MNVLSLFDGMSCGQIAFNKLKITFNGKKNKYFASEIDPYATTVTKKNYPDTIHIGDVTKVRYENGVLYTEYGEYETKIDMIIGGSPCQGFSFAGKMLNFNDERSKLFFEFVRILKEIKPKYFLLENVQMKKEYEEVISAYLGVTPIIINSSLVSAQNRTRLYWTNIPNIVLPEDRGITWGDVREHGVDISSYYYSDKALKWIHRHGCRKQKKLKIHSDAEKMQMLEASHYKKYSSQRYFGILDNGICNKLQKDTLSTLCDNLEDSPFTDYSSVLQGDLGYRYITPIECERLQNVPDNYTDCVSNTQRYKMLGNGWTVDVISHILNHANFNNL